MRLRDIAATPQTAVTGQILSVDTLPTQAMNTGSVTAVTITTTGVTGQCSCPLMVPSTASAVQTVLTNSSLTGVAVTATVPSVTAPNTASVTSPVTAPVTSPVAVTVTAPDAEQETQESAPQSRSDQEKRRKRKQTRKLKSVLSGPERRQNVPQEEEFLRAVEAGDFPTVRRMLRNNRNLDVNCTDLLGRTPLRIAVQNENEEIVEILLDRAGIQNMYESLLLAISLEQESIALIILRHPMYTRVEQQTRLYSNDSIFLSSNNEDSLFAAETTPLILAAQKNSYEVLSLLLDRGAKIEEPHDVSCVCSCCKAMVKSDDLRNAKSRLNAYRGLTSQAYICLSSPDPILTAFNMRRKIKRVAQNEKHYRDEYEALGKNLSEYVVKLLDCVRGDEELDVLLNVGAGGQVEVLGRLNLAIRLDEKKFVAHSSCQKKLATIWYGDVRKLLAAWPCWVHPIFILLVGVMFPITSIAYLFAPAGKVRKYLQVPFIKFIGQSASFFVFLLLICCFSLTETPAHMGPVHPEVLTSDSKETEALRQNLSSAGLVWSEHLREYNPPGILMVLSIFIIGMVWQECKQLYFSSLKEYFASPFNMMDTLSLLLYLTSFSLRYVSYYMTYEAHDYFHVPNSIDNLIKGNKEAIYWIYWVTADRFYWDAFDPLIVAEGLFAVANVVSFSRLFYLLAANEQLGPLQISLRRMMRDIMRFMAIFVIICVAFLVGLNNLYWYYEPTVRGPIELTIHPEVVTEAEEAFGTIEKTFTTVFWAIFGMGEASVVKLGNGFPSAFTERVGYCVFGAYNIAIVIILLNMLIAMMSRSFEAIADEQDVEWKFARAQLYMDFIQEGGTLPVPFNLFPSPKTLYRLGAAIVRSCSKGKPGDSESNSVSRPNKTNGSEGTDSVINGKWSHVGSVSSRASSTQTAGDKDEVSNSGSAARKIHKMYHAKKHNSFTAKTSFETVLKRIVKRYIFENEQVDNTPLEGDIDELKQDLSGLRFEMSNLFNHNQKKTNNSISHLNTKLDLVLSILANQAGTTTSTTPSSRIPGVKLNNALNKINHKKQDVPGEIHNMVHGGPRIKSRFNNLAPRKWSLVEGQEQNIAKVKETVDRSSPQAEQGDIKQVKFDDINRPRSPFQDAKNRSRISTPTDMPPQVAEQRGQHGTTPGDTRSANYNESRITGSGSVSTPRPARGDREVDVDSMEVRVLKTKPKPLENSSESSDTASYSDESEDPQQEDHLDMYALNHKVVDKSEPGNKNQPSYSATYSVLSSSSTKHPTSYKHKHRYIDDRHSAPLHDNFCEDDDEEEGQRGNYQRSHSSVEYDSDAEEYSEGVTEEVSEFSEGIRSQDGEYSTAASRQRIADSAGQPMDLSGSGHEDTEVYDSHHHDVPYRPLRAQTQRLSDEGRKDQYSYVNTAFENDITDSGSQDEADRDSYDRGSRVDYEDDVINAGYVMGSIGRSKTLNLDPSNSHSEGFNEIDC